MLSPDRAEGFVSPIKVDVAYSIIDLEIPSTHIVSQAIATLGNGRLIGINRLTLLTHPAKRDHQGTVSFIHEQEGHAIEVGYLCGAIAENNGLTEAEVIKASILGCLHDRAIPAMGDATKKVDPDNLNEEDFWYETVDPSGWNFLDQNGLDSATIDETLHNRGTLGQILDVADRISYVTRDMYELVGTLNPEEDSFANLDSDIRFALTAFHDIGNIYKDVRVDEKGQVFFSNPERLKAFLLLRSFLYRELYLRPTNVGRDLLFKRLLERHYSSVYQEKITPHHLREMNDYDLLRTLSERSALTTHPLFPTPLSINSALVDWEPDWQVFDTYKEAAARAKRLARHSGIGVIGIQEMAGYDPATTYRVMHPNGTISTLQEYDPEFATRLEREMEDTKRVYLFTDNVSELTPISILIRRATGSK